ncbi:2-dehydropantoate 2-reductase [Vibrio sp. CAIM 722]|uniref:2-dehydropantoate 2-reductase n=1 Tax=Vibrio eleionomae TaxID=2653505 RepID=A0A7X4RUV9_9VIBR|nr:2-dehydropantoate 2-reductase [Vibrio eleionomae]MZI94266.1 2-dehydropantoate 2-reductase [Vibrio eleionomae]
MEINNVALIGLGAMGAFFAPRLNQMLGNEHFCVIASGERKTRLETQGVTINQAKETFRIVSPQNGQPMDLIIIAVKEMALEQAMQDIEAFVGEHTQILCVMNGIDSEERLIAKYGAQRVLYSYMRISIVMTNGVANFNPQGGWVHFGEAKNTVTSERVAAIQALLNRADIPYRTDDDMIKGLWFKFMCNVSENLTCALLGVPFGAFHVSEHANAIRRQAMYEVKAIANAKGVELTQDDIDRQEQTVGKIPFPNKPSTLQDLEQNKRTEIDMFAGKVLELGEMLNITTPLCFMFYHGIKVLEEKNGNKFAS